MKPIPGVVIFRFQAPLCFINSGVFRARLEIACDIYVYKNKVDKKEPNGCIKELLLLVCYVLMYMLHNWKGKNLSQLNLSERSLGLEVARG